ncbi:cytochrome c oxidase copper chaperone [Nannochloropsis gaditana]|uniref:Cytochrome c oxidase copper chaperone n=1 Tax=Nannochloropsis gaditana TaxID=72520 RepID=W7TR74_9STRA|nr:cytochrome c oxidase copper chaperone [Nannochloropsis gaditana]
MGTKASKPVEAEQPKLGKSGKKICCSCPDTKKIRDECVVNKGEEACADAIEAHKACLRAEGFKTVTPGHASLNNLSFVSWPAVQRVRKRRRMTEGFWDSFLAMVASHLESTKKATKGGKPSDDFGPAKKRGIYVPRKEGRACLKRGKKGAEGFLANEVTTPKAIASKTPQHAGGLMGNTGVG